MTFANVSENELVRDLVDVGDRCLFPDDVSEKHCISDRRLVELARKNLEQLPEGDREHCMRCVRCARTYSSLRSAYLTNDLPDRWHVVLSCNRNECLIQCDRVQVFGRISVETLQFTTSSEDAEWCFHPLYLRVSIVLDFGLSLISVSVLDVPPEIRGASIQGPLGWMRLIRDEDEESLDLDEFFDRENALNSSFRSLDAFLHYLEAGRVRIRFDSSRSPWITERNTSEVADMLFRLGAVEHDSPYWLPNELRTDTHINVGKLCRHEFAIRRIASAFDECFARERFDCILSHGWAMGAIGRRLAQARARHGKTPEDITCMGYDPPMLTADIAPSSRVLVLVDVTITGRLVAGLKKVVADVGATVVGVGAVASANADGIQPPAGVRALCTISMRVDAGAERNHSPALAHEWVFNPFSCTMTKRIRESRSPSEFLQENREAASFWQLVDRADAYQLHKKERNLHYIAFVDTLRLLQHDEVGDELVAEFCKLVRANFASPDVVLVPGKRERGKVLGQEVVRQLGQGRRGQVVLVMASWGKGRWRIRPKDLGWFPNSRVLVIDTAIGHGKTIESLCKLAYSLQPASVGAAVLISRISESGEIALDHRLSDGFVSMYHLPIQPFVIRGSRGDLCPICAEKAAVKAAMEEEWGRDLFDQWAKWLARVPMNRVSESTSARHSRERPEQLTLFPTTTDAFLKRCRPKTAGAVTLHSLGAAKMNGMASLSLPELQDSEISSIVKTAMVDHLPPGILEWSGPILERDLEEVLATSGKPGLWRATARVMSRERYGQWYEYLGEALQRFQKLGREPSDVFWGSMIWNAYVNSQACSEAAGHLRAVLDGLRAGYSDPSACSGIERMLRAISCLTRDNA